MMKIRKKMLKGEIEENERKEAKAANIQVARMMTSSL